MARRQMVTLEVIVEVDADEAEKLVGSPGWSDPSGDGEPPISGLTLRADQLVWTLAHRALEEWSGLDAFIVEANGLPGEITNEDEESEF